MGTVRAGASERSIQQSLIDATTNSYFTQIHSEATRQKSLLDLVFTTNPTLVRSSVTVPGIADHDMVVTDIDTKPSYVKQQKRKCFLYSRANWDGLNSAVKETEKLVHNMIVDNNDIDDIWSFFKESLMKDVENFIPSKMKGGRPRTPWINQRIKRMLRKKHRLFKQARKTQTWDNYRNYQRECKKEIRRAEYTYVNEIIEEGLRSNNCKPFWRYVKSRKQDNIGVAPLKDNTNLVSDSKGKAKILLKQFQSVFTPEDKSPLPPLKDNEYPDIGKITISIGGVAKLLKSINPTKACGPDAIPNQILKNCADTLAPILNFSTFHQYRHTPKRLEEGKYFLCLQKGRQTPRVKL